MWCMLCVRFRVGWRVTCPCWRAWEPLFYSWLWSPLFVSARESKASTHVLWSSHYKHSFLLSVWLCAFPTFVKVHYHIYWNELNLWYCYIKFFNIPRRRRTNSGNNFHDDYDDGYEGFEGTELDMTGGGSMKFGSTDHDMKGRGSIKIANPVYYSMYPEHTET